MVHCKPLSFNRKWKLWLNRLKGFFVSLYKNIFPNIYEGDFNNFLVTRGE